MGSVYGSQLCGCELWLSALRFHLWLVADVALTPVSQCCANGAGSQCLASALTLSGLLTALALITLAPTHGLHCIALVHGLSAWLLVLWLSVLALSDLSAVL